MGQLKKMRDLASFVPLYLEGQAFYVYDEMEDGDKQDVDKIEKCLRAAFEDDRFTALYEKLCRRRWKHGEPVVTYLADLRRLAKLARIDNEEVIRNSFIVGLPPEISQQLRASVRTMTSRMAAICEQARVLLRQKVQLEDNMAVASLEQRGRSTTQRRPPYGAPAAERKCFICGGNHLARGCAKRADRRSVTCWTCGEAGHMARQCGRTTSASGNDFAGAEAPDPATLVEH